MKNVARISSLAVLLIVLLRVAIGWQLFYEGIWKIKTQYSPKPWTAAGYLKNSQGPMRDTFRKMTGDPDDLSWLDAESVESKWHEWQKRFVAHYALTDRQKGRLNALLNGTELYYSDKGKLDAIPEGVDLSKVTYAKKQLVTFDEENKRLAINGELRLQPREKQKILDMATWQGMEEPPVVTSFNFAVNQLHKRAKSKNYDLLDVVSNLVKLDDEQKTQLSESLAGDSETYSDNGTVESLPEGVELPENVSFDEENKRLILTGKLTESQKNELLAMPTWDGKEPPEIIETFRDQLEKGFARASRLSYKQRLRATLGNLDMVGKRRKDKGVDQLGEIEKYTNMLNEYETSLASAKQDFQHEHLTKLWSDVQQQKTSVVGPIRALDTGLRDDAQAILTVDQLRKGPVPKPWNSQRITDWLTIAGLACLGLLLIVGLFTRFSALMGAIMLFSFYMAMPPLPGLPEAPGPEHSLVVNKNLIEVAALLAIATMPSGYWFGLDKLVYNVFAGKKSKKAK